MKKALLILALASFTFAAQAQQKIGYINSLELLSLMPGIKTADAQIEKMAKSYENQLKAMQKEGETKLKDLQTNGETMSEAIRQVKIKEIESLEKRMQEINKSASEKLAKKKEELYKPVLEKANKAILDVAKANGFAYILDSGTQVLVYADESNNVMSLVKTKLGIQ